MKIKLRKEKKNLINIYKYNIINNVMQIESKTQKINSEKEN